MPGDEQRRIAKTYITAFLPATLQARREYLYTLTLPAGTAANWRLTQTSTLKFFVAPMNEDVDLPGRKKGRRKREREREKKKEEETKNQGKEKKKERESPDFTIELVDNDGATVTSAVSRFVSIPPPFKEKFTKLAKIDEGRVTSRIGTSSFKRFAHRSQRVSIRFAHVNLLIPLGVRFCFFPWRSAGAGRLETAWSNSRAVLGFARP